MMRVFLITVAVSLAAGIGPASALSCAQWCSKYHCRNAEAGPQRVCMNRCVASCRAVVRKRNAHVD